MNRRQFFSLLAIGTTIVNFNRSIAQGKIDRQILAEKFLNDYYKYWHISKAYLEPGKIPDRLFESEHSYQIVYSEYPTELAIPFLTGYLLTKDPAFLTAAIDKLNYAHSLEHKTNGQADGAFLIPEWGGNSIQRKTRTFMHRDRQGRIIRDYYTAYKITGNKDYLNWSINAAEQTIARLPRTLYTVKNVDNTNAELTKYTIFTNTFLPVLNHPNDENFVTGHPPNTDDPYYAYNVNDNMNSTLALAFGLLANDPNVDINKRRKYLDIAFEELGASLAIQTREGKIPSNDYQPINQQTYDTLYNSFGYFNWVWLAKINLLNNNQKIINQPNQLTPINNETLLQRYQRINDRLTAALERGKLWLMDEKYYNLMTGARLYSWSRYRHKSKYFQPNHPFDRSGDPEPMYPLEVSLRIPFYWYHNVISITANMTQDYFQAMTNEGITYQPFIDGKYKFTPEDRGVLMWAYYVVMGFSDYQSRLQIN